MRLPTSKWQLVPDDPRAPTDELWASLTDDERAQVVAMLPSSMAPEALGMAPEGDRHGGPVDVLRDTLRRHFGNTGRDAYIGRDLLVYYPNERVFAPDIFVVLDVGAHPREHWMVQHEQRGLDLAIEVLVRGNRAKDLELNVERYARLGIREYFVFEPLRARIHAFRLDDSGRRYVRMIPQRGRFRCEVLGLEVVIDDLRMRFVSGDALLPTSREVERALNKYVDALHDRAESEAQRAESEAQRAESEAQRAESEAQRANEAERRLGVALDRLRELGEELP